jgi:hypothetical protein
MLEMQRERVIQTIREKDEPNNIAYVNSLASSLLVSLITSIPRSTPGDNTLHLTGLISAYKDGRVFQVYEHCLLFPP